MTRLIRLIVARSSPPAPAHGPGLRRALTRLHRQHEPTSNAPESSPDSDTPHATVERFPDRDRSRPISPATPPFGLLRRKLQSIASLDPSPHTPHPRRDNAPGA